MLTLRILFLALGGVLALAVSGCGSTDPYIYKQHEFNRNEKDFNKPVTDRDGVTFCYNGYANTDAQITRLAENECARFGKLAIRQEETFGDCPMLTPVQARFACKAPDGAATPVADAAVETDAAASPDDARSRKEAAWPDDHAGPPGDTDKALGF